jgi:hypothetical protein
VNDSLRIALVYPGTRADRRDATPSDNRFAAVCAAIARLGAYAEPAVYHDDFAAEVRDQLLRCDGALVWVNPIEDERDRSVLDAMLREVGAAGVYVSAHPDVILALGTKEVLYRTRDLGWGCETYLYATLAALKDGLARQLAAGQSRVLKQYRGNGGDGVWKVDPSPERGTIRVRHAKRGCVEERMRFDDFVASCAPYFAGAGRMIDQAYQPRLAEGMVRCYLVHGRVEGFGLQAINALYPAAEGAPPESAPQPGPRLYHPPTLPAYQRLKRQLEREWVPAMQQIFGLATEQLPALWDCDFLLGPKTAAGDDTYVLCEINVSSVSPFPDSALEPLARAAIARAEAARRQRR